MKVQDSSINQAAVSHAGRAGEAGAVTPGSSKKGSGAQFQNDHVQLSDLSGRLVEMLGAEAPDRTARIEKLTAEYRSGRYQPDALAASQGMVAEALANEP